MGLGRIVAAAVAVLTASAGVAAAAEKLTVYTSMKESLIGQIRDAFMKRNPEVQFDYYSAGAGKLMAKIAAERQSGQLTVDVLWHSEVPDFIQLKRQGMFEAYVSPEAKFVQSTIKDPDGYFTPARLGTLGIAYNTRRVTNPPKSWADLADSRFRNSFGIANPALSGTAYMSLTAFIGNLGWEYIEKLKANGAKIGAGSGEVVDDAASGDLRASLGVDYIVIDKIQKGANLAIVFPQEMLVVPSPVAIMKGTPNLAAAKKFIDFLLSKDAQTIIANSGTLPIRSDVEVDKKHGLVPADEAVKRAFKIDYEQAMKDREETITRFNKLMR
jgi:iron(III) transport system substrate-binding protein